MSERASFRSNFGFIMAAAGSAVGLGNIWKFPYITGEYGGGAFVLVYLVCIALVGLPLMYAELIIGRRGGSDVMGSLRTLIGGTPAGGGVAAATGLMAVASGFLILSFYSVVAGWAIHFLAVSLGLIAMAEGGAGPTFEAVAGSPGLSALWHTCFMALVVGTVVFGVEKGIERICRTIMPALLAILLLLFVYVGATGGLGESLAFLFAPDFSKLSGDAVLEALGHAFFTLSLGMGAMITYGSYLGRDEHVVRDGIAVAFLDTLIALLAGAVIFAVVFAGDGEPGAGPGLVFVTLPNLFQSMPGGSVVAIAFFVLLIFAAWSSGISLLEVVVAWLVDTWKLPRLPAALGAGALIWALGLTAAKWGAVIDALDNVTTKYMLPGGGLLVAIAAGWLLSKADREAGFVHLPRGEALARGFTVIIRFVTPVLVLAVILGKLGLFSLS
jgi:NSS family neurotransmitter:Na+ symporter